MLPSRIVYADRVYDLVRLRLEWLMVHTPHSFISSALFREIAKAVRLALACGLMLRFSVKCILTFLLKLDRSRKTRHRRRDRRGREGACFVVTIFCFQCHFEQIVDGGYTIEQRVPALVIAIDMRLPTAQGGDVRKGEGGRGVYSVCA